MAEHGDFVRQLTSITSTLASPQSARAGSEQLHELLVQQHSQPCLVLAHKASHNAQLLQRLCDGLADCLQSPDTHTIQLTAACIELLLQPPPGGRGSGQEALKVEFKDVITVFLETQVINSTAKAALVWLTASAGALGQGMVHQRAGACSCINALIELLHAHEENSDTYGIAPAVLEPDTAADLSKALLQELSVQSELLMTELQMQPYDDQLFWPWKIHRQEYCALLLDLLRRLAMMVTQTTLLLMPPSWGCSLTNPPAAAAPPAAAGPSTGSAHASAAAERYMPLLLQLAAPGPFAGSARRILSSCLFDLLPYAHSPTVRRLLHDCPHLVQWLAEALRPPQLRDTRKQPSKYKGMAPVDAQRKKNEERQFRVAELLGSVKLVEQLLSMAWWEFRQGTASDSDDSSSETADDGVASDSREGPARLSPSANVALSPPLPHLHQQPDPAVHPFAAPHSAVLHAEAGGSMYGLQYATEATQLDGTHIVVKQEPQLQPDVGMPEPHPDVAYPGLEPHVAIPELAQALLKWQIPERVSALSRWAKAEGKFKGAGTEGVNSTMQHLKELCGSCMKVMWAAGLPKPRPLVEHVSQQKAVVQSAQAVGSSRDAPAVGRKRAAEQKRQGPSKAKKGEGSGDGTAGLGAGRDIPAEGHQHNEGDASGGGQLISQVLALPCTSWRPVIVGASSTGRAELQQPGRGRGTGSGKTAVKGRGRGGGSAEPQAAAGAVDQPLLGMPLLAGEPLSHEQRNSFPKTSGTQQELQGAHPTLHDLARAAASRDTGEAQRSEEAAAAPEGVGYTAAGELQLAMQDQQRQHAVGDEGVRQGAGQASADLMVPWEQGPATPWAAEARAQQPGSIAGSPDGAGPSQPAGTAGAGISGSGTGGHNRPPAQPEGQGHQQLQLVATGTGQHAGGSHQAPVDALGLASQHSRDARKQHRAVLYKLLCTVDDMPVGPWMSEEKQATICETLTRLRALGPSQVQDMVTEEDMSILTRHMAKQRYGAAVILIDGLVEEMAAVLRN